MAERLEGMLEELTDMAMDALRRASSGDPDSAETGEALAMERRILKARRALEKSIAALSEGRRPGPPAARRRRLSPHNGGGDVRLFVAAWPDDETRRRLGGLELELGKSKGLRFVGPVALARDAAVPR